ncbi:MULTISPECIES: hypothetical protein [Vibrio]|nr:MULTISPECIES: hypothetical protein [Vibrio]MBS9879766.1 hypothetical protein [Vibrio alginolyticus]MDW2023894.1 hypothetical protein [Vibrio sp. 397]MDW2029033.1 hypothetical protein [Vibrio sp. 399]MDW2215116.1 hypothetical protein [Vibrio sp. 1982]
MINFELSIREKLDQMSSAKLIEQRQLVIEMQGDYRHLRDSESNSKS